MKKRDMLYSFVIATVFTCFYAFLITAEPGSGLANSMLAAFDLDSILSLALIIGLCYVGVFAVTLVLGLFILCWGDNQCTPTEELAAAINTCCKVSSISAFLLLAFGFISWGGF